MAHLTSVLRRLRLVTTIFALALIASACGASSSTVDLSTAESVSGAGAAPATTAENPVAASEQVLDFDATPAFLAMAAEQVELADSVRFEMFIEVDSMFAMGSRTEPFAIGQQSGNQVHMTVDMGTLLGGLADAGMFDAESLTMEIVTDSDAMYLRAPFFAEMLGGAGGSLGPDFAWVDALATGWGKVRLDGMGGAEAVEGFTNLGGLGAEEMIDMLRQTGDVQEGGTGDVRGVPTKILIAEVSLDDLVAASGQSAQDLGLDDATLDGVISDTMVVMEVHVDEAGLLRRVEYEMDFGQLVADEELGGLGMSMWQRMDFFGYGESVDITIPTDAVDITDDLESLEALGGF